MSDTELRISIRGLRPGMYVARLDRPWLETPHDVQGFQVSTDDDVARVSRYSKYVYIDTKRGASPEPRFILHDGQMDDVRPLKEALPALGSTRYEDASTLPEEIEEAREARDKLQSVTNEVVTGLKEGKDLDLVALQDGLKLMIDSIVRNPEALAWLAKLKSKDTYTYHHSLGASIWAATFARHLGLPRRDIEQLALGGVLLDVGKTRLPEKLLVKNDRLTPPEVEEMKRHVDYSVELLDAAGDVDDKIMGMVATHHERFDGGGYPRGLRGEEIPLYGRIAAVVDTYDAVTSLRPYATAMSPHGAVGMLYEWRGVDFQPELVEQFIQAIGIYPTGTLVELTTGEVGVITSLSGTSRLRPRVMLILDPDKLPYEEFREVDLMHETQTADGKRLDIKRGLAPGAHGIDPHELYI